MRLPIHAMEGSILILIGLLSATSLMSCGHDNVPPDTKHIDAFHLATVATDTMDLYGNQTALFVDYSNCIADGMDSPFYRKLVSPLAAASTEYWSIKGNEIKNEAITDNRDSSVYSRLKNVTEISYAALDEAIRMMSERNTESVLLTDGELFIKTATKNNANNPYMHAALKKWLMRGHDIYILSEPYTEHYNGNTYDKKRFYIIFTDDRLQDNIYSRIEKVVDLKNEDGIGQYHLSGNYPWKIPENGKSSIANTDLTAQVTGKGSYEIQEWELDWERINDLIVNGIDENGEQMPNGKLLISGLNIDRTAFNPFTITDIDVRVTNINEDYFNFYNEAETGPVPEQYTLTGGRQMHQFIIADKNAFRDKGDVMLYFDAKNFAPQDGLNGNPYNYFKIEIYVSEVDDRLRSEDIDFFNFDSIVENDLTNSSISESIKNCIASPELKDNMLDKVLYTIYVKSNKI